MEYDALIARLKRLADSGIVGREYADDCRMAARACGINNALVVALESYVAADEAGEDWNRQMLYAARDVLAKARGE